MSIEKRRHQRLDVAIEVRVRGKDKSGQPVEETTVSGNISVSGCSLLSSTAFAAGSELELEFLRHVPGRKEPVSLAFRGAVVRATPLNQAQYTVGIEFKNGQFPMEALEHLRNP